MPKWKSVHKNQNPKNHLSLIRCECGTEILLIPDLKAMSAAIEEHIILHMNKQTDFVIAEAEAERIRNLLTTQVLAKASES